MTDLFEVHVFRSTHAPFTCFCQEKQPLRVFSSTHALFTCLTSILFLLPQKWKSRGVYFSGVTLLNPVSAPPSRILEFWWKRIKGQNHHNTKYSWVSDISVCWTKASSYALYWETSIIFLVNINYFLNLVTRYSCNSCINFVKTSISLALG